MLAAEDQMLTGWSQLVDRLNCKAGPKVKASKRTADGQDGEDDPIKAIIRGGLVRAGESVRNVEVDLAQTTVCQKGCDVDLTCRSLNTADRLSKHSDHALEPLAQSVGGTVRLIFDGKTRSKYSG